jgi:outer membrane lipoprotein-sorting protein
VGVQRGLGRSVVRAVVLLTVSGVLLLASAIGARQKTTAPRAASGPTFDELYRSGQKLNAGLTTLRARFTETTTSSLLERQRPNVERGLIYVQRPARRVALHYTDPPDKVVIIDGDRMTQSMPSLKILERRDVGAAQKRVQRYFETNDPSELRKVFDITLLEKSGRPGTRELTLVPKRKQIQEALKGLDLWVEESSGLLSAMRMTFSNGDIKLMEFADLKPGAPIDPQVFSVPKPPAPP